MNGVDPTGEDYWSTSDPNVIYDLWKYYNDNKGIGGYNFQGWYQMSDKDFLAAYDKYGEQALTYNDQTSTLYTSYGRVENGEVVTYGKQIKLSQSSYRPVEDNELQLTGEPPLPGFSAFKWASLWKSVKGLFKFSSAVKQAAPVVKAYTKSNLRLGRQIHAAYKVNDVIDGVAMKEFRGIPGIRPDFVDFSTRTIYELKPFNPKAMQQGWKQLYKYQNLFQQKYGGTWNIILDTY